MIDACHEEPLLADLFGRLEVETKDKGKALAEWSDLPPKEAIDFFKKKKLMSAEAFKRLDQRYRRQAFAVAGLNEQYAIERVHGIILQSIQNGTSQREAVKQIRSSYSAMGLTPQSPHHLDLVFRNQVQGAYAAGRWSQLQAVKRTRPYWQYSTAGDDRVRESHAAMSGKIFAADDPIWGQWYPPNGHNCRCTVISLSKAGLERDGRKVSDGASVGDKPDPGWAGSPASGKKGDRSAKQVQAAARESKVLRPPRVASKGARAYSEAGGLAQSPGTAANEIDRWSRLDSSAIRGSRSKPLAVSPTRPRRLPAGAAEIQVPIASQHVDAAEQLVRRIAGEPELAGVLNSLKISARYSYGGAATSSADVVAGGIVRRSQLLLSLLGRTPEQIAKLAEVALSAEAASAGALRRAATVADVVLAGSAKALPGYRKAVLNWRKAKGGFEYHLTKQPLDGFSSREVQITEARYQGIK